MDEKFGKNDFIDTLRLRGNLVPKLFNVRKG